jgi:DUF438 domain-containing protein
MLIALTRFPFPQIPGRKYKENAVDETMLQAILDAIPYPIVFVDTEYIIRFMNKKAKYHYYQERGYSDLVGQSLFACHNDTSRDKIEAIVEKLKNHGNEVFLMVNVRNERIYVTPVRNEQGELLGFFERFELNRQV